MIVTQVVWPGDKDNFTFTSQCQIKAAELGGSTWGHVMDDSPKYIVQRSWVNETVANEWIAFVLSLGAESATIVENSGPEDITIEIKLQKTVWQTRVVPGPGYNVTEILDSVQSAREAGELDWVDWDQPLRLYISVVE
jgi:hypothetical protein